MSDEIAFLPTGAILQSFRVGGVDIVQGFPSEALYAQENTPHFGETIGRVANRIAGAAVADLNHGQYYTFVANNGPNCLHGGAVGWGKKVWTGPEPVGIKTVPGLDLDEGGESVKFSLVSPDGDEGFPGTVNTSVVYTVGKQKATATRPEATVLSMEYEAELVEGADETVINMTNHTYFNLAGTQTIEGTVVELVSNSHLPLDSTGIPTAGPTPYPGVSPNTPFTLGSEDPDFDDCFVVSEPGTISIDTRSQPLVRLVAAHHPATGIHLEVYSTEPAFQFYTGKYIDVPAISGVPARGSRSGFCVEPSRYVNAINEPAWRDQVLLKKGETYGARIVYRAWKE